MAASLASSLHSVRRPSLGLLLAVTLTHCAHPQANPESAKPEIGPPVEWYIAQRDPLTYCPKGHQLPPSRAVFGPAPIYVYLADRTTRFYIPPRATSHQQQALELRQLSKSESQGLSTSSTSVNSTIRWVGRALARTAVTGVTVAAAMLVGAPGEGSIADSAMEAVWADYD